MLSARKGHLECVSLLLKAGADVNLTDAFDHDAIYHNTCSRRFPYRSNFSTVVGEPNISLDLLILAKGDEVNASYEGADTALMSVSRFGDVLWVKSLIKKGADVNMKNKHGTTALMMATRKGNDDCTEALLEAGADVNAVNNSGCHALMFAAQTMNYYCITWLQKKGAEVKDDVNHTYINLVIQCGVLRVSGDFEYWLFYKCIQSLLKIGAYINQATGKRALEFYNEVVKGDRGPIHMLLLAAGEMIDQGCKSIILEEYLTHADKLSLKHLSREAVRKQMITTHPHDNLFQAVPKLGIPSKLHSYLLYDISLDDYEDDEDFDELWIMYGRDSDASDDASEDLEGILVFDDDDDDDDDDIEEA